MRHLRLLFTSLILFVALGAALYTQRVRISDVVADLNRPELPEAVGFEEVAEDETEDGTEEVDETEGTQEEVVGEETEEETGDPGSETEIKETEGTDETEDGEELPVEFNLAVPFTPQAPFANWDHTHEEACEEASLYMAHLYYDGVPEGLVDAQTAEDEIMKLVEYEMSLFGFFEDTTAEQTALVAEQFYGYSNVDVVVDPTVDDIKTHIAAGRPVIVPAAGRLLGNPYFTAPGPDYHMLVLRGYTSTQFITNDPGTRRGEAFTYDIDTIMNAMHDWNGDDPITDGRKAVIVIYPE